MKQIKSFSLLLSILFFLIAFPLVAADLTYDMASGKISGFDVTNPDNPSTPSSYTGATEVWQSDGFVGRLNYRGEPTTITFSNTGDTAVGASANRFYFTYLTNGVSKLGSWREIFLVTRVKGLYHNGTQHDFVGTNTVIANNNGSLTFNVGAGPEQVTTGQAYSVTGAGPSAANSTYKYKYKYQYIWIDVTIKKTDQKKQLDKGYYFTQITASSTTGASYTMMLIGQKDPQGNQDPPSAFYYGVESVVSNPFPFTDISSKNSIANSLLVGKLKYFSVEDSATVKLSSNTAGTGASFNLLLVGGSTLIPYSLVFDPTAPNTNAVQISSPPPKFYSAIQQTISPIDGTSTPGNVLEGDIRIFVPTNTLPLSGTYSSTIYCILTQE